MRTELLKKMYKTISCKYATFALACHLHSYNKKTKNTIRTFLWSLFLSCTKLRPKAVHYRPSGVGQCPYTRPLARLIVDCRGDYSVDSLGRKKLSLSTWSHYDWRASKSIGRKFIARWIVHYFYGQKLWNVVFFKNIDTKWFIKSFLYWLNLIPRGRHEITLQ